MTSPTRTALARLGPRDDTGSEPARVRVGLSMRITTTTLLTGCLTGCLAGLVGAPLEAQETEGPRPRSVAAAVGEADSPVIDGVLDDAVWTSAEIIDGFVQREPIEGRPVSERTEVRVLWDDEALYFGAWNYLSDTGSIVFGETRRDASLDNTDAFLLILDTYLDRQNGFVFGTTPAGIEYDGQVTNEGLGTGGGGQRQQRGSGAGFNLNWDGSWDVATSIDDEGWYAEIRIPFSTLRYPTGGPQTWGANFARNIRDRNEQSVWSPLPRQFSVNRVSLAGELSGFEAPARRIFTVTPYVLGDVSRDYVVPGATTDWDAAIGGDAKIGLNQSLTLDLTVNTDFAQVEVDDVQVNLTRFPLFFPEKRPFFLENAGTFAVGSPQSAELFFSRRIGLSGGSEVPILGGARMTGRVGGMQLGFLNVQTRDLSLFDDDLGEDVEVEPNTNFGVVRLFREFENRSRIGGVFVSRLNTDDTADYNLTYGVDGRLGFGQALTFDGWAAGTSTPDTEGDEYGLNVGGRYETRDWRISAGYREISESFNPEAGFLPRSEYRHVNARVLRAIRFPEVSWFRELRPHVSMSRFWDFTGFSESYVFHVDSHFEFESGQFFQFPGLNFTGEGLQQPFEIRDGIVIPAGSYNNVDWEFRSRTNLAAPLSLRLNIDAGGFYNGTRIGTSSTLAYRFQDKFVTELRLSYFDVNLEQGDFVSSVVALKGSYTFTPRIFFQATLQYNNETENFGSNLRFGWLDTAGTGLYVVFNDLEHFGSLDRTGLERGPQRRQLIIKYTQQFNIGG